MPRHKILLPSFGFSGEELRRSSLQSGQFWHSSYNFLVKEHNAVDQGATCHLEDQDPVLSSFEACLAQPRILPGVYWRSKLQCDPWSQTLDLLRRLNKLKDGVAEVHFDHVMRDKLNAGAIGAGRFKVCVTGRPSIRTVTVSWCTAGCVYYGDQVWRHAVAVRSGVCAMSGEKIRKGDPIYKPACSRETPMNMNAMILAAHIDRLAIDP